MSKESISNALKHADETKFLKIGSNILSEIPEIFQEYFPNKKAVIIADENTYGVAGSKVHDSISKAGLEETNPFIITDPDLYADYRFVQKIVDFLKNHDAISIAVGSGVINDLTKRANSELERPYMCVATAASMDGYSAYGASITKDGAKMTMSCPAPTAIVADLDIICKAPPLMTASGYADLYAKVVSGADWILADALGVEAIDNKSWHIVQDGLDDALKDPDGAKNGKITAIEPLIEGLMLGGFAIQSLKSSRPASGAEHQFSHLWDMEHHTFKGDFAKKYGLYPNQDEQAPSHGFKVGIGLLTITALYEKMLDTPIENLDIDKSVDAWKSLDEQIYEVREMFKGSDIEDFAVTQITKKYISKEDLKIQLTKLKENWSKIKSDIRKQVIPYQETKKRLKLIGAPTKCEEIGISKERLRESFYRAQKIRDRFTILDVALRTGYLNTWVEELFSEKGFLE